MVPAYQTARRRRCWPDRSEPVQLPITCPKLCRSRALPADGRSGLRSPYFQDIYFFMGMITIARRRLKVIISRRCLKSGTKLRLNAICVASIRCSIPGWRFRPNLASRLGISSGSAPAHFKVWSARSPVAMVATGLWPSFGFSAERSDRPSGLAGGTGRRRGKSHRGTCLPRRGDPERSNRRTRFLLRFEGAGFVNSCSGHRSEAWASALWSNQSMSPGGLICRHGGPSATQLRRHSYELIEIVSMAQ